MPGAPAFTPAWWLPGAHAQTVGARVLRPPAGVPLRRERVVLPDSDFVDLDWTAWRSRETDPVERPLVIVLHGLEGSARSKYALEIYRQLRRYDVDAVGLNFRSCSGTLNRGKRLYHSGETEDLRFVLRQLRARYPDRSLGAIGVSLGGNVLLKFLGEECERAGDLLRAAAAISVPFDLSAGADHLEHGFARVYVWRLLRSLKRKVRARRGELGDLVDVPRALAARTFREFDDAATAPLHGFASAEDYYQRSSSRHVLNHVRVPVRVVQALDDPFLPAAAFPHAELRANPVFDLQVTRRGGHVGFVTGSPWAPRFWAEATAARFVAEHLVRGGAPSA